MLATPFAWSFKSRAEHLQRKQHELREMSQELMLLAQLTPSSEHNNRKAHPPAAPRRRPTGEPDLLKLALKQLSSRQLSNHLSRDHGVEALSDHVSKTKAINRICSLAMQGGHGRMQFTWRHAALLHSLSLWRQDRASNNNKNTAEAQTQFARAHRQSGGEVATGVY